METELHQLGCLMTGVTTAHGVHITQLVYLEGRLLENLGRVRQNVKR